MASKQFKKALSYMAAIGSLSGVFGYQLTYLPKSDDNKIHYSPRHERTLNQQKPSSNLERIAQEESEKPIKQEEDYVSSIREDLIRHEGYEPFAYTDTEGNKTVGVGYNLERPNARSELESVGASFENVYSGNAPLSDFQIKILLDKDIETAKSDAIAYLGISSFDSLKPQAKDIVTNMAFNLGRTKLNGFKNLRDALQNQDYKTAAKEMLDSKWASDVKGRAIELANKMRTLAND